MNATFQAEMSEVMSVEMEKPNVLLNPICYHLINVVCCTVACPVSSDGS